MDSGKPAVSVPKHCLNCEAEVIGPYCHRCGQKQGRRVVPLRMLLKHMAWEYWSLDNRFTRTLKLLLFKPGQLTRKWRQGKRGYYIPPFRIYLAASVIYFFILGMVDSNTFMMGTINMDPEAGAIFQKWLPRLMFIFMPLFAAALQLLHRKHKRYYVEHLVFALHYYSFFFIIDSVRTLLSYWLGYTGQPIETVATAVSIPLFILSLIPMVYLGIAIKKAYPQSLGMLLLRLLGLIIGYVLVMLLGVAIVIFYLTRILPLL